MKFNLTAYKNIYGKNMNKNKKSLKEGITSKVKIWNNGKISMLNGAEGNLINKQSELWLKRVKGLNYNWGKLL